MKLAAKTVLAALVLVLALGVSPSGAGAHAQLVRSEPADGASLGAGPLEVILYFTEGIEVDFSEAYVLDSAGKRWEQPNEGAFHIHTDPTNPGLIMLPNMPNGVYTTVWDVLSAVDGHRTKGFFTFYVGPPPLEPPPSVVPPGAETTASAPPEWLEVFSRWANFAAMAALLGAVAFPFLILPAGVAALHPSPSGERAVRRILRTARISAIVASLALVAASLLSLWVQAWLASGDSTSVDAIKDLVTNTRFGEVWTARILLAGGAVAASLLVLLRPSRQWHESIVHPSNTQWAVLLLIAVAVPVTTSLNSHAAASGSTDLQTVVDYIHLLAGGLWLGLLVQLLLAILVAVPLLDERAGFLGATVRRFSIVAVPSVAVIVITGVIQSIDRLGGIDELFDTDYGSTLVVKILLLAPLLIIAAFNLLIVGPRFLGLARGRAQAVLERLRPWERRFRAAVVLEVGIAVAILAVTALLTNTSPPGSAAVDGQTPPTYATPTPNAESGQVSAGDMNMMIWADPGTPGPNSVNILLQDKDGDPKPVQKVIVRYTFLDENIGTSEEEATGVHPPDHYVASTNQLSLPGQWEVEVIVRREGVLDVRGTVELTIGA
jgi:copper transport protein